MNSLESNEEDVYAENYNLNSLHWIDRVAQIMVPILYLVYCAVYFGYYLSKEECNDDHGHCWRSKYIIWCARVLLRIIFELFFVSCMHKSKRRFITLHKFQHISILKEVGMQLGQLVSNHIGKLRAVSFQFYIMVRLSGIVATQDW